MHCPKIYAIYLPQFYETENNNKWWGDGFTEWTAVKMAEPLYEGHDQPRVPLDLKYYNLLNKETIQWQAALAKDYGIDGFSFYHYYFGDGRMELEKPAENLLKWKDIDMPFYFCWANQSWVRTWSKFNGNVWTEKFDEKQGRNSSKDDFLIEQKYGDEKEWEKHFKYLLPFFKDERYICLNGCPLITLLGPRSIPGLNDMVALWQKLAVANGLKGITILGYGRHNKKSAIDGDVIWNSPIVYTREYAERVTYKNGIACVDCEDFYNYTVREKICEDDSSYFQAMCCHDTTPRRGNGGECIIDRTPKLFKDYISRMLQKTEYFGKEFLILNAWNEWGEGMYLEPDTKYEYAYLEAIREAKKEVISMNDFSDEIKDTLIDADTMKEIEKDSKEKELRKFRFLYRICSKWIDLLQTRDHIFSDYFNNENIRSVAIYGFGSMGNKIYLQLKKENIEVKYLIDIYLPRNRYGLTIYRPEEGLPKVDAIIVTPYEEGEITELLNKRVPYRILSMEDILNGHNIL